MRPGTNSTDRLCGVLVTRFSRPLMSFFLRRRVNRVEAEDMTQEVLMRVLRASGDTRIQDTESYVFKIAENLLRDNHRHQRLRDTAVQVPIEEALASERESQLVENLSPERLLLGRDLLADALRTLDELGERTRNIFVLSRLQNMKQKDIAAIYGIGQSTVEKHVTRAVQHLAGRYCSELMGRGRSRR
jgi:RNA polymerase sigma-70 factor (ECF subfamily)